MLDVKKNIPESIGDMGWLCKKPLPSDILQHNHHEKYKIRTIFDKFLVDGSLA